MTKVYPAIIHEEKSGFWIEFPDLPGCQTYVTTDVNKYHKDTHAVKKMLSIPAWLVKEAEKRNISLSKVLQEALKDRLGLV